MREDRSIMNWLMRIFAPANETTFYSVNRDGALVLDLRGLLATGRMNKQLQAARTLARRQKIVAIAPAPEDNTNG